MQIKWRENERGDDLAVLRNAYLKKPVFALMQY